MALGGNDMSNPKNRAMKKQVLMALFLFGLIGCQGQNKEDRTIVNEEKKKEVEQPKGNWEVDKEFDENGNLVRYDSIYSWSSMDPLNDLTTQDKDSLLNNFESKFYRHFSQFSNQGFGDIFEPDSLFSKRFFNDGFFESDFGKDFMELDRIRKRMMKRQMDFLEKYRSETGTHKKDSL
jgi:hypothetical protein